MNRVLNEENAGFRIFHEPKMNPFLFLSSNGNATSGESEVPNEDLLNEDEG